MFLNYNTKITMETKYADSSAVRRAVENLRRDLRKSCLEPCPVRIEAGRAGSGTAPEMDLRKGMDAQSEIRFSDAEMVPEGFTVECTGGRLEIRAGDALGFVYGIYTVSREILGIQEFWFWNDQIITQRPGYEIPENWAYKSKKAAVRYRGWFINDEVLLHTWSVNRRAEEPWEMAFEALLRCGGNLVIPGTDRNSRRYRDLAASMGLYITHHHAEPLGAEMFARAYPNLNPSYEEQKEKYHSLWRDAVEEQKEIPVVWNIGFRGQGDYPFWENDPRYQTQESRGKLMSHLIRMQYDMVRETLPDAVCCTNLYGETMELYRDGCLDLPDDVIKIWADNGFGKMVTRRQDNHNPRVCALPSEDCGGAHGIYYHVSFYDLQAANHMTMLPNSPEFVREELKEVLKRGMNDYWLINCSNIKPHVYFLDLIARLWENGDADVPEHRMEYMRKYYGEADAERVAGAFARYPAYAQRYGEHEDDHAGEQFSNHVARILISQYMRDREKRAGELLWATKAKSLKEQILWYEKLCAQAKENYGAYLLECERTDAEIAEPHARELFRDSLMLQVRIHFHCFTGAWYVCESLLSALETDYQKAFYNAGKAREHYLRADQSMRDREHGKWNGFYANECLADMKQTAWVLEGLMSYVRNLEDGPHYYKWQREYLYSEEDRRVMLVMNMENHLRDEEIFELMKERFEA